jgi:hypothetical protein
MKIVESLVEICEGKIHLQKNGTHNVLVQKEDKISIYKATVLRMKPTRTIKIKVWALRLLNFSIIFVILIIFFEKTPRFI